MPQRREVIDERLKKLDEVITVLGQLQGLDGVALRADPLKLYTAERGLQVAIECILDIGSHLIAVAGWRRPKEYADVIRILAEQSVIPTSFAQHIHLYCAAHHQGFALLKYRANANFVHGSQYHEWSSNQIPILDNVSRQVV